MCKLWWKKYQLKVKAKKKVAHFSTAKFKQHTVVEKLKHLQNDAGNHIRLDYVLWMNKSQEESFTYLCCFVGLSLSRLNWEMVKKCILLLCILWVHFPVFFCFADLVLVVFLTLLLLLLDVLLMEKHESANVLFWFLVIHSCLLCWLVFNFLLSILFSFLATTSKIVGASFFIHLSTKFYLLSWYEFVFYSSSFDLINNLLTVKHARKIIYQTFLSSSKEKPIWLVENKLILFVDWL